MLVSADGCGIYFNVVPLKGSNAGRPGGSSCGMGMGKWLRGIEEEELAPSVVENQKGAHRRVRAWFKGGPGGGVGVSLAEGAR